MYRTHTHTHTHTHTGSRTHTYPYGGRHIHTTHTPTEAGTHAQRIHACTHTHTGITKHFALSTPWCQLLMLPCPDLPGNQHILHSCHCGAAGGPGAGGLPGQSAGLRPGSARHWEHEEENPGCECQCPSLLVFVWERCEIHGAPCSGRRCGCCFVLVIMVMFCQWESLMMMFCFGYYGYVLSAGVIDNIILFGLLLLWLCFVSRSHWWHCFVWVVIIMVMFCQRESLMTLFCLGGYYYGYVLSAGVIDDIVLFGWLLLWLFCQQESLMTLFCLGYCYYGYVLSAGVIDDIVLFGLLLLWLCFVSRYCFVWVIIIMVMICQWESLMILFCLGYCYYGYILSADIVLFGLLLLWLYFVRKCRYDCQFLPLALLFVMVWCTGTHLFDLGQRNI